MASIWTESELRELIAVWKKAYKAAATGKSYTIQGRTLTRYDLPEIRKQLEYFQSQLDALSGNAGPYFVHARIRGGW